METTLLPNRYESVLILIYNHSQVSKLPNNAKNITVMKTMHDDIVLDHQIKAQNGYIAR